MFISWGLFCIFIDKCRDFVGELWDFLVGDGGRVSISAFDVWGNLGSVYIVKDRFSLFFFYFIDIENIINYVILNIKMYNYMYDMII